MGYFCVAQKLGARVLRGVWDRECEVPGCSGGVGCSGECGADRQRCRVPGIRECGVPGIRECGGARVLRGVWYPGAPGSVGPRVWGARMLRGVWQVGTGGDGCRSWAGYRTVGVGCRTNKNPCDFFTKNWVGCRTVGVGCRSWDRVPDSCGRVG